MDNITNITRFDEIEFDCLQRASGIGYYSTGERAERAKIMMKDGILVNNPQSKWGISGWKLTEMGVRYNEEFIAMLNNKHGHVWKTNHESDPDIYDESDEYAQEINIFAYSSGYHNGPECKYCGFSFCEHCESEFNIPQCSKNIEIN